MNSPSAVSPSAAFSGKVLFLQHSSLFESYGGIEYYLDDLLSYTADLLGRENVLSLVPQRTERFKLSRKKYLVEAVRFSKNRWLQKLENRFSLNYLSQAIQTIQRFRPTYLVSSHVSLGPLTFALAQHAKIPYATVVYGIEAWGNLWPQDEFALKHSHQILSISYWTKKVLALRGYPSNQIQIFHPGLNPDYETLSPTPRIVSGPLKLLTVGRLDKNEQYKGQDHVLQALRKLKDERPHAQIEYRIQGEGSDRKRLEELCETLKLTDCVKFYPAVKDRNELTALYQWADLFIMPSRYGYWDRKWRGEGFGIVYVDAAAFSVPSLAYACGGATDIIRADETGILVNPDDIAGIAEALATACDHPERLIEMGKNAYQHVRQKFTYEPRKEELFHALSAMLSPST